MKSLAPSGQSKFDSKVIPILVCIGLSQSLFVPERVLKFGGLNFFLSFLLSAIFFSGLMFVAEMLLSQWLQRPFVRAYRILHKFLSVFSYLGLSALVIQIALILNSLAKFAIVFMEWISGRGFIAPQAVERITGFPILQYFLSLFFMALILFTLKSKHSLVMKFRNGSLNWVLLFCFLSWSMLAFYLLQQWGYSSVKNLFSWRTQTFEEQSSFESLTLASVIFLTGCGIYFQKTFVFFNESQNVIGQLSGPRRGDTKAA